MPRISYRLSLVLALAACSAEPAVDAVTPGPSAEQNAYDDSDCNLQTVLDPDKPGAPGLSGSSTVCRLQSESS